MPTCSLYLRPTLPGGRRPYLHPASSRNRLRPGWAMLDGTPTQTGGDYYLRFADENGKRVYHRVGPDLSEALPLQKQIEAAGATSALGLKVESPIKVSGPLVTTKIAEYLRHMEVSGRADRTLADRAYVMEELSIHLGASATMDAITPNALLEWAHALKKATVTNPKTGYTCRKNADSTIWKKLRFVRSFLLYCGMDVLKRRDFPRYAETTPDVYTAEELVEFFSACTPEEHFTFSMLFGTGLRHGELANLLWSSMNLDEGVMVVQSGGDWKTKNRRTRFVPLPAHLVEALKIRRAANPSATYVLRADAPAPSLLPRLKEVSHQAGLTCGRCHTKSGKSCADGPYCKLWVIHKLRRSYATHLYNKGTDLNTLRTLLGHKSSAPLMRYIAPANVMAPELRAKLTAITACTLPQEVAA